ncbi:apiosidase-like domain-containing protein [Arenibaculum pallidiluteum]|uniref:apiosidase-like domain-containing protein n=1 Tax=Arenibaculum pallidiluteum TaxID=2812559 RepID=UPI001A969644|nr:DUF4038 domain-containing protein [Arenibaculum pallidiluteum]
MTRLLVLLALWPVPVSGGEAAPAFPVAPIPGRHHLADARGEPFLIHGDTAWSLIAQLTREEVDRYLADRRRRGFNTLLVSLIERRFARNAPANAYGEQPFLTPGDFGTPNERYFVHADWVLRRAREEGFLVLLAPAYVGAGGGDQGWYREMVASGPDTLQRYGTFLGRRYRDYGNILWVHGGDENPPDRRLPEAIARGIRSIDPGSLHTAHTARDSTATEYWRGAPWIGVDTIYTYGSVRSAALRQYSRSSRIPFFLIEAIYENEHEATEQSLRAQAYYALLSGAAGQVFGSNPIWHFDGPGLFDAPLGWREALDGPGSRSMTQLRRLMDGLKWWQLDPDLDGTLLVEGSRSAEGPAVAARSGDGSLGLVFMPTARRIAIDLGRLAGPWVRARWYDPADGSFRDAAPPLGATGRRSFEPDAKGNSSGYGDWLLVLESHS